MYGDHNSDSDRKILEFDDKESYNNQRERQWSPVFFGNARVSKYPAMFVTNEPSLSQHRH